MNGHSCVFERILRGFVDGYSNKHRRAPKHHPFELVALFILLRLRSTFENPRRIMLNYCLVEIEILIKIKGLFNIWNHFIKHLILAVYDLNPEKNFTALKIIIFLTRRKKSHVVTKVLKFKNLSPYIAHMCDPPFFPSNNSLSQGEQQTRSFDFRMVFSFLSFLPWQK